MELAGDASTERKLDRYLDAEIIIEDLDESSSELHGFTRDRSAIHSRNKQLKEPFCDEFLIRQFIKLPTTVQRSVAEGFWEVDPAVAQILNRILDLAEQEKGPWFSGLNTLNSWPHAIDADRGFLSLSARSEQAAPVL